MFFLLSFFFPFSSFLFNANSMRDYSTLSARMHACINNNVDPTGEGGEFDEFEIGTRRIIHGIYELQHDSTNGKALGQITCRVGRRI